jgi:hypothetical protein
VAFSCKGRGVCPSCNGRHMAQNAAHLADHVIPPVPVRQWVISVPKRLRGFRADRPRAIAVLTKIFLTEIERTLITVSGVTAAADTPSASHSRLGGISFLHRFGSALNHHVRLHACVTEGVFMPAADGAGSDAPPAFLPARSITQADLAALTAKNPSPGGRAAVPAVPGAAVSGSKTANTQFTSRSSARRPLRKCH